MLLAAGRPSAAIVVTDELTACCQVSQKANNLQTGRFTQNKSGARPELLCVHLLCI